MKDSTKRLYSSLISLSLMIGSFYVYFSLVAKEIEDVKLLRAERSKKQVNLAEYKKASEETKKLQLTYQGVEAFKSNLSKLLPNSEELPFLMNQVYGLASLNNVTISGVDFRVAPPEIPTDNLIVPIAKIVVSSRASGKYDDLKSFFNNLESNMRIFDLKSVNITGGGKIDPTLDVNFSFDTYYQTQSK